MSFEHYHKVLSDFQGGQFDSVDKNYQAMCLAQDQMIDSILSNGASIKGWKVVEKDDTFIISPIFDFQLMNNQGERFDSERVTGFEVELCYLAKVPETESLVDQTVAELQPKAAIEIMRDKINPDSHIACDFFFNYGIMVSDAAVNGAFEFHNHEAGFRYDYSAADQALLAEKERFFKHGLLECIRRGYKGEFFFMTGSLNGMLDIDTCRGTNVVSNQGNDVIQFEAV